MATAGVCVRFAAGCYPAHPLLVYTAILAACFFLAILIRQWKFRRAFAVWRSDLPLSPISQNADRATAEGVTAMRAARAETARDYGLARVSDVMGRCTITFSEGFIPLESRIVAIAACVLASVYAFVCLCDVALAGCVLVDCVALGLVALTPWYSFEHEASTFVFVVLLLAQQVAICVAYLRSQVYFPILVSIGLVACALFALHPFVLVAIKASPARLRPALACLERERLAGMEYAIFAVFAVTSVLTPGFAPA